MTHIKRVALGTGEKKRNKKANALASKIANLGRRLVKCPSKCDGIYLDRNRGIIPRCLVFEYANRPGHKGAMVVGLNPGQAYDWERKLYKDCGCTYHSLLRCWEGRGLKNNGLTGEGLKTAPYYKYLRDFVDCLGFNGPILWTELVKCQNKRKRNLPPAETFRKCTHSYLKNELKEINNDWPLIAVGKEAYKALVYLCPTRALIGIPHPNSRGQFHSLFQKGLKHKRLRKPVENHVREFKNNWGTALWLGK